MNNLHWTTDFLIKQGVREEFQWIALGIDIILLILISWVADFIARRILLSVIQTLVKRSKATWDDYFFEQKIFKIWRTLSRHGLYTRVFPLFLMTSPQRSVPRKTRSPLCHYTRRRLVNRTLRALEHWTSMNTKYANTPIRTISQVIRILAFFGAVIAVISILTGTKAGNILGAPAGTTAIIILVFQDSIKGLLAISRSTCMT